MLEINRTRPFIRRHTSHVNFPFQGQPDIHLVQFRTPTAKDIWRDINHQMHNQRMMLLEDYYPELLTLCEGADQQSVCAKIIRRGDTIAECFDCRVDSSCVICKDCYDHGNHQGHKVVFKKAHGGCCDCGDTDAWKPEGFCSNHSGEMKDVDIDPTHIAAFSDVLQDMFYIFYRLKQTGAETNVFHQSLKRLMQSITQRGIKGIKMLSLFLQSRFHETHRINQQVNSHIFLHNLLHFKLMDRFMKDWENIFISMFPYYPFKQQLLVAYVQCFPQIYLGDEDGNTGQSLSCQILTSYKLVEDYIKMEGSLPLGYNLHEYLHAAESLGYQCAMDLDRINSLQGDVPLKYWRFQLKHGIKNLFLYYQLLRKNYEEQCKSKQIEEKTEFIEDVQLSDFERTAFIVTYVLCIQSEHGVLRVLNSAISIIHEDKKLLQNLICQLVELIQLDNTQKDLIIFRPYDRLFALALYAYIERDLFFFDSQQNIDKIRNMLGLTEQQWQDLLGMIFKRIFTTFTFFSHILINEKKGYNSSFYDYLNVYHINDHLIANTDILLLKMIFLSTSRSNRLSLFFQQAVRLKELEQLTWNLSNFTIFMQQIGLLYTGKTAEIYISYEDLQPNSNYDEDIRSYLSKYMTFKREAVGFDQVGNFCQNFLFNHKDALRKNLKEICVYDREKKTFKIKEEFKDNSPFNFKDYELRTREKNNTPASEHPKYTLQFINGYNKIIFLKVWSRTNLEKLREIIKEVYKDLSSTKVKESLVEFFTVVCKFVCLLTHCDADENDIENFKDLLRDMDINSEIRNELTFYKDILSEISMDPENDHQTTNNKKDQMQQKKMRKMEELRKKHSEGMNLASQIHLEEFEKIKNQNHQDADNGNFCVICRIKEQDSQLVYLSRLSLKNLQKLGGFGNIGQETVSFKTCYHVFHLDCINNSKGIRANLQAAYKCPLCRKIGNTLIPIKSYINSEPFVCIIKACLFRLRKSFKTLKQSTSFNSFNVVNELVIGYYNYVLMSQFYFEKVKTKRKLLYKTILQLLCHPFFRQDIQRIKVKLRNGTLTFMSIPQTKPNRRRLPLTFDLEVFDIELDNFEDDLHSGDQYDEEFIHRIEETNERILRENTEREERMRAIMEERLERSIHSSNRRPLKKKRNTCKGFMQTTAVFKYTLERVIDYILKKQVELAEKKETQSVDRQAAQQPQEKDVEQENQAKFQSDEEEVGMKLPEVSEDVVAIVDDLLDVPNETKVTPISFKLIELPSRFNWDLTKNVCFQCKSVSVDAAKCLHCSWIGCFKCNDGGVERHTRAQHGLAAAFMRMKDSMAIIIDQNDSHRMGFLYANEWGDGFRVNKNWEEFSFQQEIYQKIKLNLICEE